MIFKNNTIGFRLLPLSLLLVCLLSCSSLLSPRSWNIKDKGYKYRNISTNNRQYELNASIPNFKLKGENGKKFDLYALQGRWVVLYFWTRKSKWSVYGLNSIYDVQKTFGDKMQTICLECYKDPNDHTPDVSMNNSPVQPIMCYCGLKSSIFRYFNVQSFPTRVLISPEGKVIEIVEGAGVEEFPESYKKYMTRLRKRIW